MKIIINNGLSFISRFHGFSVEPNDMTNRLNLLVESDCTNLHPKAERGRHAKSVTSHPHFSSMMIRI